MKKLIQEASNTLTQFKNKFYVKLNIYNVKFN